jgi:hypothetical protein
LGEYTGTGGASSIRRADWTIQNNVEDGTLNITKTGFSTETEQAERVRSRPPRPLTPQNRQFESLCKIWNFGVANAKILPCRLQKSRKSRFLRAIDRKNPQY